MREVVLRKLDSNLAEIKGRDLSIEDLESGRIYLTRKNYIDKLFKAAGYRSLSVIKILEEFAGRTINKVGNLDDLGIFIDDDTDSFIVTRESSIKWVNRLYKELEDKGYKIVQFRSFDDYYYWDQLWVQSHTGTYFALYIDLCDECVYCLSLDYSPEGGLKGIINEGSYDFSKDDSFDSLMILMDNPVNISYCFNLDMKLSYREYIDLLKLLGYVKKKKKAVHFTEEGEELSTRGVIGSFDFLDNYNEMTWIQRIITSSGYTYSDVIELITSNIDRITFWDLRKFFELNSSETSDISSLN